VEDDRHNKLTPRFLRYDKDIYEYNEIAAKIMNERKIPVIDLYSFTKKLGMDGYEVHIHFKQSARELQAAFIAGQLIGIKKGEYFS